MSKQRLHILSFAIRRKPRHPTDDELSYLLYTNHHAELIKYVSKILKKKDFDQIEDVVAETFIRALENKKSLRELKDPKYWLCGIAKNICKDIKKNRQDFQTLEELVPPFIPHSENSDFLTHYRQLESLIMEAKETMTVRQRVFFRAYWREDLSVEDIADRHQVTPQHVSNQLVIARKLVKNHLQKHDLYGDQPHTQKEIHT